MVLSCASLTTGTSSPRGAATPNPRCTAGVQSGSAARPVVSTHVEFKFGWCRSAIVNSRRVSTNGVIGESSSAASRTGRAAASAPSSRPEHRRVRRVSACATTSFDAPSPPARRAPPPCPGVGADLPAAASTSSRVITPSGPEPGSRVRSTFNSAANFPHRRLGPRPVAGRHRGASAGSPCRRRRRSRPVPACVPCRWRRRRRLGHRVAMRTSTEPTSSVSPSSPPSSTIRPAYGLGISTSALLVSTVHSVWFSSTVVADRDVPAGDRGVLETLAQIGNEEVLHTSPLMAAPSLSRRSPAAGRPGQPQLLQPCRRIRRVKTGGAQHRCLQVVEQLLLRCARPVRRRSPACAGLRASPPRGRSCAPSPRRCRSRAGSAIAGR